ncbi:MAG: MOSC domain-containing protein [Dehalococcoidia bacterium]
MSQAGSIFQINVSNGGVPKLPIEEGQVVFRGLTRDRQGDLRHHGSLEQALCLYSIERLAALAAEGHHVSPGATGENLTLIDVDWDLVVPGRRLRLGDDVVIEVTDYASPCSKNARWFKSGDFSRIDQELHPGFSRVYARVLIEGVIRTGDTVTFPDAENAADRLERLQPHTYRWPRDFASAGRSRES